MTREPKVLLEDIRLASERILAFTAGKSQADFAEDLLLHAAVERLFILIGEAVTRLDKSDSAIASRITDKSRIISFRNILVHGYETVLDATVWRTVTEHLPRLLKETQDLIATC